MSITATSSYMSNADILEWMETKTDGLYGQMRDAMDTANTRTDAESALNDIKAKILATEHGGDAQSALDAINDAMTTYKDDPEVVKALQPLADSLNPQAAADASATTQTTVTAGGGNMQGGTSTTVTVAAPVKLTINANDADTWSKDIDNAVDDLGKKDQLGMISIQDLNSQLGQAKQIASALIDSADKSADAIVNHIS